MHMGLPTSYSLRPITWPNSFTCRQPNLCLGNTKPMSCFSVRECQSFYTLRTCWPTPRERIDEIELA